jgi:MFS transporter, DHA1 family, tetracycline resistance protein
MFLTKKQRKLSLASIFFTFFVDNLSWTIVFPIFAPYFLDIQNKIFAPEVTLATRTMLLSLFLAIFPFAQFFGAPLIGEFADKEGRKKALAITIFCSFFGLVLSAISIAKGWLWILFISRLLTGLFSGNLSVCMASIADLTESTNHRGKHFGYLAVVAGFSFIIGAYLGGKFSDSSENPFFNPALPFWIGTVLMIINFFFIIFFFKETKHKDPTAKFVLFESVHNIKKIFEIKRLTTIYLIYFFFLFSWNIPFQFTPVLTVQRFNFANSDIGDMAAFMGVCWAIGSGFVYKMLLKFCGQYKILESAILLFTLFSLVLIFAKSVGLLLAILGICVVFAGIAWPVCTNLISQKAGKNMQGKVLGLSQSMQSLAMALSPLVGFFIQFSLTIPFIAASLFSLIAGIFYFGLKK